MDHRDFLWILNHPLTQNEIIDSVRGRDFLNLWEQMYEIDSPPTEPLEVVRQVRHRNNVWYVVRLDPEMSKWLKEQHQRDWRYVQGDSYSFKIRESLYTMALLKCVQPD